MEAEAAQAKAEAKAAIQQAEAATKPTSSLPVPITEQERRGQKIGAISTGPSPRSEWEMFRADLFTALAGVKAKRMAIRDERIAKIAAELAQDFGAALAKAEAKANSKQEGGAA